MASDDRIPITYYFDEKSQEIHMRKGKGDEILEDKVVAHYDPESQALSFKNANQLRLWKLPVTTFLAENEMLIKSYQRADLEPDKPLTASIPPRPKKTKAAGDKTPAVVEWYRRYKPNEFKTRYGVIGTYTGPGLILEPIWEPRPVDRAPEYRGESKNEVDLVNVMVATRTVVGMDGKRLTFTVDECLNFDEDDPESGDTVPSGNREEED